MYFIKFGNVAVFVKQSSKLGTKGRFTNEVFYLEDDDHFNRMSKKSPFANCRRMNYFNQTKKNIIPGYILNYVMSLDSVKAAITTVERDIKINSILGNETRT